jgi:hypothetical protein
MFVEALIDHRPMGIAERHARGVGGETFPDKLDEAQSFLDRELQNFRDIRIAHGI